MRAILRIFKTLRGLSFTLVLKKKKKSDFRMKNRTSKLGLFICSVLKWIVQIIN